MVELALFGACVALLTSLGAYWQRMLLCRGLLLCFVIKHSVMLLQIDDDIVYIADDTIQALLEEKVDNDRWGT